MKFSETTKKAGNIISRLIFGVVLERLGIIETKIDNIEKRLESVEGGLRDVKEQRVIKIENFLIKFSAIVQSGGDVAKLGLYEGYSPLQINEKGKKILKDTYFEEGIDDNIDLLFDTFNRLGVKSALDVESLSIGLINYMVADKDVDIFKKTEDYLYTHPEYNNSEIFKVAGLYLRDKYLERHPELDPTKNK